MNSAEINMFFRRGLSNTLKGGGIILGGICIFNGVLELFCEHTEPIKYVIGGASALGFTALGKIIEPRNSN